MKKYSLLILVTVLSVISSCNKSGQDNGVNERKDIVLTRAQQEYVQAGNAFSIDFYRHVAASGESMVVSPLSVQTFLGALNTGLVGKSSSEICMALGYGADSKDQINSYLKSLSDQLKSSDKLVSLNISNAFLFNTYYDKAGLKETFREELRSYYGAWIDEFDFTRDLSRLKALNNWVSTETGGMIERIFDAPDPINIFHCANVTSFSGRWSNEFDPGRSKLAWFYASDGSEQAVSMMNRVGEYCYGHSGDVSLVKIPYGNGAFEMVVVLPDDRDGLLPYVQSLTEDRWDSLLASASPAYISLSLPKFTGEYDGQLNVPLSELGINALFSSKNGDLSGMTNASGNVGDVHHKVKIEVSEQGTTAASVTWNGSALASVPKNFVADHPFLYAIRETSTGAIIFMGQYCGK